LFIVYDEAMVKEATNNSEFGIHVGGQAVNMIRSDMPMIKLWCAIPRKDYKN